MSLNNENEEAIAVIGCMGLVPAAIVGYLLRGWAIVTLWGWFVTPVFHMQPPNAALAIGVGIVGSMLAGSGSESSNANGKSATSAIASAYGKLLLHAPMAVGIGWIVKHWA
jgi:hypothetical protein